MDNIQAKKIIGILSKAWSLKNKKDLSRIVDFLDKGIDKEVSFYNGFEFSFVENAHQLRLLHLNFWNPDLAINGIRKVIEIREKTVYSIFKQLHKEFSCCYNLPIYQSFCQFNNENGPWPIQFGLAYQEEAKPKIKVYLSLNEQDSKRFPLKNFFCYFNLDFQKLNKLFIKKYLDVVAIDFLSNNKYLFKFYPYIRKNQGYLYRILPSSRVTSIKSWNRFPDGLLFEGIPREFCFSPLYKKIIKINGFKAHYLCKEGNKQSVYFR